jgi:hypothetical protein
MILFFHFTLHYGVESEEIVDYDGDKNGRLAKDQVRGLSTIVGCDKSVITLFSLSPVRWNGQHIVVCRYEVMATYHHQGKPTISPMAQ